MAAFHCLAGANDLPAVEERLGKASSPNRESLLNHMRTEHSTPEEVGRTAREARAKLLVLAHLVLTPAVRLMNSHGPGDIAPRAAQPAY